MSIRELSVTRSAHADSIWSVCWLSGGELASGGVDECLHVWRAQPDTSGGVGGNWLGERPRIKAAAHIVVDTDANPDASLPLSASLAIISVARVPEAGAAASSHRIVTSSIDGTIRLYDTQKAEQVRRIDVGPLDCWSLCVSPDGSLVATGGRSGLLSIWSLESGAKVASLQGERAKEGEAGGAWVMSVAWSEDGRFIAAGHYDGRVTLFPITRSVEASQGVALQGAPKPLTPHHKAVRSLKFSPDSTLLFTASDDCHVHWYDVAGGGELMHDLNAHQSWVTSIDLPTSNPTASASTASSSSSSPSTPSSSITTFATTSSDRKLKVWSLLSKECLATTELDSTGWSVAYDAAAENQDRVAVATEAGTIYIMQVPTQ